MKKFILFLTGIVLLIGCNGKTPKQRIEEKFENFEIYAHISPSFHVAFSLKIVSKEDFKMLTLTPIRSFDYSGPYREFSIIIPDELYQNFIHTIYNYRIDTIKADGNCYVDGIRAFVIHHFFNNDTLYFETHSPDYNSPHFKIMEQIFKFANKLVFTEPYITFLEDAEDYFEFCKGAKITNTNPFTLRIYGCRRNIPVEAINNIISKFPKNENIILDFSNFENGTSELDSFITFTLKNYKNSCIVVDRKHIEQINNILNERNKLNCKLFGDALDYELEEINNYLKRLGINEDRIYRDYDKLIFELNNKLLTKYSRVRPGTPAPVPDAVPEDEE